MLAGSELIRLTDFSRAVGPFSSRPYMAEIPPSAKGEPEIRPSALAPTFLLIVKVISRHRRETLIWYEIVANVVDTADKNGAYVRLREKTALFTRLLVIQADFMG